MALIPIHTARQLRNASMSALYRVAYEHDVDLSDVMASITPSQPSPASQASAARTYPPVPVAVQAEGVSQAASSADHSDIVQPISPITAAPAANPDKPTEPQAKHAAEGALSSEPGEVQDRIGVSTSPPPSLKRGTKADLVRRCHEEHPDWPAKMIATHLGLSRGSVSGNATIAKIKLPSQREYDEAQRAATTEALKTAPAKPQEPVERAGPPTPRPEPKQPPAPIPAEPFDDDEPAPVIRRVMKAPTGRFYLREPGGDMRFVHQSLQPSPTGPGPLMTSDRKWAWYDTMERYRGAKKLWPELADMRKEAASV